MSKSKAELSITKRLLLDFIKYKTNNNHTFFMGNDKIAAALGLTVNSAKVMVLRKWGARLIALVVAGYGIFAFHKRQIGEYLLMKMHFVFYDYTENVMFFMLDYLAVMILIAVAGYYISMLLKKIK